MTAKVNENESQEPKDKEESALTVEVAEFLYGLVNSLQLLVSSPDFDETYHKVSAAKRQLLAIIGPRVQPRPNRAQRRSSNRKPTRKPVKRVMGKP